MINIFFIAACVTLYNYNMYPLEFSFKHLITLLNRFKTLVVFVQNDELRSLFILKLENQTATFSYTYVQIIQRKTSHGSLKSPQVIPQTGQNVQFVKNLYIKRNPSTQFSRCERNSVLLIREFANIRKIFSRGRVTRNIGICTSKRRLLRRASGLCDTE